MARAFPDLPARSLSYFLAADVCEAMARKQQRYRVWYLSGCGLYQHVDAR